MSKKAAKVADAADTKTLVVLGLDENEKPHAGRFTGANLALVAKAAEALGLKLVEVTAKEHAGLVARLPLGRLYSNGRAFVPNVRQDLYIKLTSALGLSLTGEKRQAVPLPRSWDDITVGSLVIAPENPVEWGYFEALVIDRNGDVLTLRWRDFPKEPIQTRNVAAVALLNADTAQ
jgi:hypothetical protein